MAKNKLRSIFKAVIGFLIPLQSKQSNDNHFRLGPILEPYSTQRRQIAQTSPRTISRHDSFEAVPSDDEVEKINRDRLEQAKLSQTYEEMSQSRDALNLTLKSQHKLLVVTLITALVALIVGVISLIDKPPVVNIATPIVNVKPPVVNVSPPDVHVNVAPQ